MYHKKIHHFYHIYADGHWVEAVTDHVKALTRYGLYDQLSSFNVGFVGSEANIVMAQEYLQVRGLTFNVAATAETGWEQVTLKPLYELCAKTPDCYVVYAHSKGSAFPQGNTWAWRTGMTRVNIVEWEKAAAALDNGYTTAGCHFYAKNPEITNPFWGGNFWWAKGDLIKALGPCKNDHRHCAEGWIGELYENTEIFKPKDLWPVPIGTPPYPF